MTIAFFLLVIVVVCPALWFVNAMAERYAMEELRPTVTANRMEDARTYHFRNEVSDGLIDGCKALPGVTFVFERNRYAIEVHKGDRYTWDEVEAGLKLEFDGFEPPVKEVE